MQENFCQKIKALVTELAKNLKIEADPVLATGNESFYYHIR